MFGYEAREGKPYFTHAAIFLSSGALVAESLRHFERVGAASTPGFISSRSARLAAADGFPPAAGDAGSEAEDLGFFDLATAGEGYHRNCPHAAHAAAHRP